MRPWVLRSFTVGCALVVTALLGCTPSAGPQSLTIYSSRTQSLVQPLLEQYARETGVDIQVRYDTTASIVSTLLEEGQNTPADLAYLGESSGLAALSERSLLGALPAATTDKVDRRFRSPKSEWVGTSGRAKV